jgi:hypothetical protein
VQKESGDSGLKTGGKSTHPTVQCTLYSTKETRKCRKKGKLPPHVIFEESTPTSYPIPCTLKAMP